ncbi:Wd Repeat-Containing Protein 18 [Manis pentadactyla]|nr:Wd Repeat-Containing Protein 18 [Manis pentadactyla]
MMVMVMLKMVLLIGVHDDFDNLGIEESHEPRFKCYGKVEVNILFFKPIINMLKPASLVSRPFRTELPIPFKIQLANLIHHSSGYSIDMLWKKLLEVPSEEPLL